LESRELSARPIPTIVWELAEIDRNAVGADTKKRCNLIDDSRVVQSLEEAFMVPCKHGETGISLIHFENFDQPACGADVGVANFDEVVDKLTASIGPPRLVERCTDGVPNTLWWFERSRRPWVITVRHHCADDPSSLLVQAVLMFAEDTKGKSHCHSMATFMPPSDQ
jgi:hypothetical protein